MAVSTGTQRIVTVVFADVVGSTAIGERLGPERSKFLFDEVVALIAGEVRRFDGTVAQLTGDGLFALFGAPVGARGRRRARSARGARDPARARRLRATRCARLRHRARACASRSTPARWCSRTTTRRRRVATTRSATPSTSPPGCSSSRRRRHRGRAGRPRARCETASSSSRSASVELRGGERPSARFRVIGAREPSPVRAVGRRWSAATASSRCSNEASTALAEGSGAIVSITGEPGIGKSRLVAEARRRSGDRVRFLEGRAGSYAETLPVLAGARAAARLARRRRRRSRGARPARAEGRARRVSATGTTRPIRSSPACSGSPLEPEPQRGLRELSREAVQTRRRSRPCASSCARSPRATRCASCSTTCTGRTSATLELVEELLAADRGGALGLVLLYRSRSRPARRGGSASAPASATRTAIASSSCGRCSRMRAARWLAGAGRRRAARGRWPSSSPSAPAATRSSSRRRCGIWSSAARCERDDGAWHARRRRPDRRCRRSCRERCRRGSTGSTPAHARGASGRRA